MGDLEKSGSDLVLRTNVLSEFTNRIGTRIRPNACRHLKNPCKLGLGPEFGLRTMSDLFFQVTKCVPN